MSTLLEESYASFVNMDHRTDRLERMQLSLRAAGVQAIRTRGMPPEEAPVDPRRVEVMRKRTPGAIGCHFSQVCVMRNALYLGKHAFVMEDDLIFCKDFQKRMEMLTSFTETHDWDVLWLGGTFHIHPPWWHKDDLGRDAECTDDPWVLRTYGAFCTYAYIVRDTRIEKVLAMLDQQLDRSIGIDYAFIQIQPQLQTFAFVPGCITQYDGKSDIGKGNTIFSGFAKLGPYWYQDQLEGFNPTTFNWHEASNRKNT
jgi:GR25 family glycosyltransferase involved in LPS biosynthesis